MNIFEIQKSNDELAKEVAIEIAKNNKEIVENLIAGLSRSYYLLWDNSKASPQDILNVFGNEAVSLFLASKVTQDFIKKLNPGYIELPQLYNFTINQDGTVTVGEKINEVE